MSKHLIIDEYLNYTVIENLTDSIKQQCANGTLEIIKVEGENLSFEHVIFSTLGEEIYQSQTTIPSHTEDPAQLTLRYEDSSAELAEEFNPKAVIQAAMLADSSVGPFEAA